MGTWDAWAAGFVDGEGAVMLTKSIGQVYIAVRVAQKHRDPLDKLVELFGGKVKLVKQGAMFEWQIYGQRALEALQRMRPYLLVKGLHADLCQEYWDVCGGKPTPFSVRMEYAKRMTLLQVKRGNAMVMEALQDI
jgi:hypothetical protein